MVSQGAPRRSPSWCRPSVANHSITRAMCSVLSYLRAISWSSKRRARSREVGVVILLEVVDDRAVLEDQVAQLGAREPFGDEARVGVLAPGVEDHVLDRRGVDGAADARQHGALAGAQRGALRSDAEALAVGRVEAAVHVEEDRPEVGGQAHGVGSVRVSPRSCKRERAGMLQPLRSPCTDLSADL